MKSVCKFILKTIGWRVVGNTDFADKCIICVAPHTSNWDLLLGLIVYKSLGKQASFLIKKEWFFFPMNLLFKALGGVPVDRSKKTSVTDQMVELYSKRSKFQLAVTPEGTRKLNNEWKKGFYYIALAANVPIVVAVLDYKKKKADFKKIIMPSGDVEADLSEIKACYIGATGRHPHKFSL
jgi:1-acyl-sn-glycerol-3-phosphate acyltransferase